MTTFFYNLLLSLHNLTRWAVLVVAVWALYRAYNGWVTRRDWVDTDARANRIFAGVASVQLVWGLLLSVWPSGLVMRALGDIGAAMRDRNQRFFVAEHNVAMIIAVGLIHAGTSRARRAPDSRTKFRRAAIFYTIAVLIILFSIPWPNRYGRPLYRLPF